MYLSAKYRIQKITDEFSDENYCIKVLFPPVALPQLNLIEMVQGYFKQTVAAGNLTILLTVVENITRRHIE